MQSSHESLLVVAATCDIPRLHEKWAYLFGRRRRGLFVEVGSFDGEQGSSSSCLADIGWRGWYIEPVSESAEICRKRHCANAVTVLECAVFDSTQEIDLYMGGSFTTSIKQQTEDFKKIQWARNIYNGTTISVNAVKLDDLLHEQRVSAGFDLLVVNVAGSEESVFNGFDIRTWRPKVILSSLVDRHPDFKRNGRVVAGATRVRESIEAAGYIEYYADENNTIFVEDKWFYRRCHIMENNIE